MKWWDYLLLFSVVFLCLSVTFYGVYTIDYSDRTYKKCEKLLKESEERTDEKINEVREEVKDAIIQREVVEKFLTGEW